ncbi:adenosine kinase [Stylonychia lemnae]|uniref:Adenosine kinase n=1 Tax=Stylonychia lemnae TaxID=5949 RepID=A0A077ZUX1_STYLE|nr:adenosine kinase [Stylonychia lemnae]|eukprot:CDW73100.1 adenosine kinase [Stylonychia lemnae]
METQDLLIVAIENPLLDISVELSNDEILTKYELQHGHACLANEKQMPIYEEIWRIEGVQKIPGGSSLNSVRSANYMLKNTHPNKCAFFGSIGNDEVGKVLEKELEDTGVHAYLHKDQDTPTGSCAVLVHNKERTLCANLAACLKYPTTHLQSNMQVLEKAAFLYTSGFFITSNFEALLEYVKFAADNNKPLGFNLSATFLIQFNTEQLNTVLEYADYTFCNEDEAKVYAEVNKVEYATFKDVAVAISKSKKVNTARPRVSIITQGKEPVIVAVSKDGEVEVKEYEVTVLKAEQVIDTNGAGDSFVGGFLSQIVQGKDLETAVKAGIWLSSQVIQRSGCTFPEENTF